MKKKLVIILMLIFLTSCVSFWSLSRAERWEKVTTYYNTYVNGLLAIVANFSGITGANLAVSVLSLTINDLNNLVQKNASDNEIEKQVEKVQGSLETANVVVGEMIK